MKLQIAFIKDNELSNKLSEDINEMEKMLMNICSLLAHLILKKMNYLILVN